VGYLQARFNRTACGTVSYAQSKKT
jgi:hypothetical protein